MVLLYRRVASALKVARIASNSQSRFLGVLTSLASAWPPTRSKATRAPLPAVTHLTSAAQSQSAVAITWWAPAARPTLLDAITLVPDLSKGARREPNRGHTASAAMLVGLRNHVIAVR